MGRNRKYTDKQLREAVRNSISISSVLRQLNLHAGGGTFEFIKNLIKELGLDNSHFKGQAWNEGRFCSKRPLSYYLVENSPCTSSHGLKKRLFREGLKIRKCEKCRRITWNGKLIPLELDHINGNRTDYRWLNLRILCPNCHAQTDTYCSKNCNRS
jgi:triphosphoribosyl-dephospho-CoA synthetase